MLERLFHLRRHGVTAGGEVRAGVVTFLTMAYILAVNPQILGDAGMPREDVAVATALGLTVQALCGALGGWVFLAALSRRDRQPSEGVA